LVPVTSIPVGFLLSNDTEEEYLGSVSVTLRRRVTRAPGDAVVRVTPAPGDGLLNRVDGWSSMHLKQKRPQTDGSAGGDAAPRGNRGATKRSSRVPPLLARLQPDRGHLMSGAGTAVNGSHRCAAGQLVVRWERRPDTSIVWLSGTLDRATATLLDRELNTEAIATMRLFVDLTGLEFIDPRGMDSLARIHRRARERGDRLSFRHGPHVAQRPLGLIRAVQLRSEWATRRAGVGDEDSYFARATACADVDHPRPGDRPGAA
jgi:ABC-type transporter Mla MlaB component